MSFQNMHRQLLAADGLTQAFDAAVKVIRANNVLATYASDEQRGILLQIENAAFAKIAADFKVDAEKLGDAIERSGVKEEC